MAQQCRDEYSRTYYLANGRTVTVILRTTIVAEDPYLNLARAKALSVRTGEDVIPDRIGRDIRDRLIKTNISI